MSTKSENAQVFSTCAHGETAKPGRGMGGTELRKCLSEVGKGSQQLQCVRAAPSSDLMRHVNLSVSVSIPLCGRHGWRFANTLFFSIFPSLAWIHDFPEYRLSFPAFLAVRGGHVT